MDEPQMTAGRPDPSVGGRLSRADALAILERAGELLDAEYRAAVR